MKCYFCDEEIKPDESFSVWKRKGEDDLQAHLCCGIYSLVFELKNTIFCFHVTGKNLTLDEAYEKTVREKCQHKHVR